MATDVSNPVVSKEAATTSVRVEAPPTIPTPSPVKERLVSTIRPGRGCVSTIVFGPPSC